jgi:hypothetical protein
LLLLLLLRPHLEVGSGRVRPFFFDSVDDRGGRGSSPLENVRRLLTAINDSLQVPWWDSKKKSIRGKAWVMMSHHVTTTQPNSRSSSRTVAVVGGRTMDGWMTPP